MLRKFVCAAVALVLVSGVALAAKEEKETKKPVFGKLVKCEKGTICVMVKKDKDDEGTKTEYKITDDTKFQVGAGKGKKPTILTDKDEIKEKFVEGTMVRLQIDEDGKVTAVTAIPARKKKDQ